MLSCTSSNKLTKGKNQRMNAQNLDNPKNGQTLGQGWAVSIGQLTLSTL